MAFDQSLLKELKALGFTPKDPEEVAPTVLRKKLGKYNKFTIEVDGGTRGEIPTHNRWALSLLINGNDVYNRWSSANFKTPQSAYDFATGLVEVIDQYESLWNIKDA